MALLVRCWRCGGEDATMLVILSDERCSDSLQRSLCARCGGMLRVWLSDGGRGEVVGTPGPVKDERRLSEDRVPSAEIDLDELMADGRAVGHLPKHPRSTESWSDSERTSKDGSSSPPVASKLHYMLPTWPSERY